MVYVFFFGDDIKHCDLNASPKVSECAIHTKTHTHAIFVVHILHGSFVLFLLLFSLNHTDMILTSIRYPIHNPIMSIGFIGRTLHNVCIHFMLLHRIGICLKI